MNPDTSEVWGPIVGVGMARIVGASAHSTFSVTIFRKTIESGGWLSTGALTEP